MIHVLDLHFLTDSAIAAFVVETEDGLVLVECGPHSVFSYLTQGIEALGYTLQDVRHVLLTHIHFDHAGAAWALAEAGAHIHVHPVGYKHMLDPTRLYGSAKRIYGDKMEELWGEMHPISSELLHEVTDEMEIMHGGKAFKAWHTPGHASHHIAWQLGDTIFAGDVAGCKIGGGPVVPPCPPPDIDVEAWQASINRLRMLDPVSLYLTHFGKITDVRSHLDALEARLLAYAAWMKPHFDAGADQMALVPEFEQFVRAELTAIGLDEPAVARYDAANPAYMSVAGLMRYWKKKTEKESGQ